MYKTTSFNICLSVWIRFHNIQSKSETIINRTPFENLNLFAASVTNCRKWRNNKIKIIILQNNYTKCFSEFPGKIFPPQNNIVRLWCITNKRAAHTHSVLAHIDTCVDAWLCWAYHICYLMADVCEWIASRVYCA